MNTPLVHPLDVAGGTGDREAVATPWSERSPVHLSADDDDWRQVPDSPLGLILVAASVASVICAMVLLL